ncbi:MAG: SDR family oxidoreductase [Aeromicrobium sp.]
MTFDFVADFRADAHHALHCAHDNAGLGHGQARVADIERAGWDRTLAVNLAGSWLCLQEELRHMEANGGESIVAPSSSTSLLGFPITAGYAATKAAINQLVRSSANEYARSGVRANAVLPGPIETTTVAGVLAENPDLKAMLDASVPMGRIGQLEEVAEAAVWLCSDRASYVTGTDPPGRRLPGAPVTAAVVPDGSARMRAARVVSPGRLAAGPGALGGPVPSDADVQLVSVGSRDDFAGVIRLADLAICTSRSRRSGWSRPTLRSIALSMVTSPDGS